jgi:hypothetical protein
MRPWAVAVLALALAASFAAGRVQAQALPPDADRDGVADDVDACPDSGLYEMVDASGCAVCDCAADATGADWSARSDYLRCMFDEIHARRGDGRLTRKAARLVVKAARSSTCGVDKVRCCIMFSGTAEGMCKVMDPVRCDGNLVGGDAIDLDGGSCFPNPCVVE